MVERCEEPRLPLEALLALFTFQESFRQDLDRDLSIEARVPRPVDLSHSSRPEGREDLVRAELRSGRERHGGTAPRTRLAAMPSTPSARRSPVATWNSLIVMREPSGEKPKDSVSESGTKPATGRREAAVSFPGANACAIRPNVSFRSPVR